MVTTTEPRLKNIKLFDFLINMFTPIKWIIKPKEDKTVIKPDVLKLDMHLVITRFKVHLPKYFVHSYVYDFIIEKYD